jgi:hypothetical protein
MSFIYCYVRDAWTELLGPAAHRAPPYKTRLRSHTTQLRTLRWLPLTPTKSHQAPALHERAPSEVSSRKCPHCNSNINSNFTTRRVSKPTPRRKKVSRPARYVKFDREHREVEEDEECVEELSPRMLSSDRKVSLY